MFRMRSLAVAILLLALLVQAQIPRGFMPDFSGTGGTSGLILCSSVDDGIPAPAAHDGDSCPYAVGSSGLSGLTFAFSAFVPLVAPAPVFFVAGAPRVWDFETPAAPRGPPARV